MSILMVLLALLTLAGILHQCAFLYSYINSGEAWADVVEEAEENEVTDPVAHHRAYNLYMVIEVGRVSAPILLALGVLGMAAGV